MKKISSRYSNNGNLRERFLLPVPTPDLGLSYNTLEIAIQTEVVERPTTKTFPAKVYLATIAAECPHDNRRKQF